MMFTKLIKRLTKHESFDKLLHLMATRDRARCGSLWGSARALAALALQKRTKRPLLLVTAGGREAEDLYGDLVSLSGTSQGLELFPHTEVLPYDEVSPFAELVHQRVRVLHSLIEGEVEIVVAPARAWLTRLIPRESFLGQQLVIREGDLYELPELARYLVNLGYQQSTRVERPGEFALKGGILDVFPSNLEDPCRVEFFDIEVESLRRFDVGTQRSLGPVKSVLILPQREIILHDENRERAIGELERIFQASESREGLKDLIGAGAVFPGIENYLPLFFEQTSRLEEFFCERPLVIAFEADEIARRMAGFERDLTDLYEGYYSSLKLKLPPTALYLEYQEEYDLRFETLATNEGLSFPFKAPKQFAGDLIALSDHIKDLKAQKQEVYLFAGYEGQAERVASLLADCQPVRKSSQAGPGTLYVGHGALSAGFASDELGLTVILEREIFNRKRALRRRMRNVKSLPIESWLDLKPGEPVVHIQHGIGIFIAIERMKTLGLEKDYLKIEYRDNEKLYVPLESVNLVQRYIGQDGARLRLDSLGGRSWERTREKVKKNVEKLARDLVEIHAARLKLEGFSFGEDTRWQHEFESAFEFEETPDQVTAIEETKADMQSSRPMDRLICGDVGFGKTEVAMRAAFRAALAGRQTAVLVPTTILAEQHAQTFQERFALFPAIRIEYLNRFRGPAEQREVLAGLKTGRVDIVIGTHRLVSDDVRFKNLGLVVIDEEHRFGVQHKEKLKQMRRLVDVLTLTATPIPRTLHMSLIKIRDMSVIRTPPQSRLPVETFVLEFNENMVKRAIMSELDRGGQIYYLHNRVRTIEGVFKFLSKLVPQARIGIAHGQLPENQLEKVMRDFINGDLDILLCTSIIESGLDIPNANTLIVDRADGFGLGQLYQIRGRVGRSTRRGFAWLFYPVGRALTEEAQKRLQTISEFTELGSGFDLALRDLEIRGVGNLFGAEQSGDIISVGFEMYCRILDEAVRELGVELYDEQPETVLSLDFEGYIPDEYIPDERQKIEVYKRIAACDSESDVEALALEVRDRFGPIPEIVESLFKLSELKAEGRAAGARSLVQQGRFIAIEFAPNHSLDPSLIVKAVEEKGARIVPGEKLLLMVPDPGGGLVSKVDFLKKTLQNLRQV